MRAHIVSRAAAIAIALGLLAAACSSGTSATGGSGDPTGEPTTSGRATVGPSRTAAPGGTSSGRPTTGSSPAATGGAATGPATIAPPRGPTPHPGTYTYTQSGKKSFKTEAEWPKEGTLRVEPARRSGGVTTQRFVRTRDSKGVSRTLDLRFTSAGVELQHLKLDHYECDIEPPLLLISLPLRAGKRWNDTATCKLREGTFGIELSAEVLRRETVTIGGTAVSTFVIKTRAIWAFAGTVTGKTTEESTTWYSPDYKLPVRTREFREAATSGQTAQSEFADQLVSLTPKR